LVWQSLRSTESASNVLSVFKKPAAETHRMLQEAFGDNAMSKAKLFNGTNASRMDECQLMKISVLDECRQEHHQKT
jgi:hypothetical protein